MKIPGIISLPFLACLSTVFLLACSPEKVWLNQQENTWFRIIKQRCKGPFVVEGVQVSTTERKHHTAGITLRFGFGLKKLHRLLLRDESDFSIEGYSLTAALHQGNGQPFAANQESGNQSPEVQQIGYRIGAYIEPEFFFPFRDIPLGKGKQEVVLIVQGYAQNQDRKTATAKPDITLQVFVAFTQPELYSARIFVDHFALDTEKADPHSFDFRMAGSGFPDLGWRLFSGKKVVHKSPVLKNKTDFTFPSGTPDFLVSESDSVRLQFFDDDELSDHDMLAIWVGRPFDLPRQTGQEIVFSGRQPNLLKRARSWVEVGRASQLNSF